MRRPKLWTRFVWLLQRQDNTTFHHLIELLHANDAAEDRAYLVLKSCTDPECLDNDVDRILSIREERVTILYQLGWTEMADRLAADTAMRRGWPGVRARA
jgi:hypothetical protein